MLTFSKNKVVLLLFTLLLLVFVSCSSTRSSKEQKLKIIFGKVDFKPESEYLNSQKFDAALSLALKIKNNYEYIGIKDIQKAIQEKPEFAKLTMNQLAKKLDADYIAIAKVNTLQHILRTEIILNSPDSKEHQLKGTGYEVLNFIDASSGNLIYDPALLKSLKRSLAVAFNDSSMFVIDSLKLNVKPLPTLVIGSIEFAGENQYDWKLFSDKVISSYAGVETIYDVIKHTQDYVVYDIETRDTIYKLFNFHIVENYSAPSSHEIQALYRIEIDYYIAGKLTKNENTAELTISLYKIKNDKLEEIKSETEKFNDDSRMVFLEHVIRATSRLFDVNHGSGE